MRLAVTALAVALPAAEAQEPQMATVVQPLPMAWEECKVRVAETLKAAGYTGFLEFGNGWIAHARGTSVSLSCIGRSRETIIVIVTAGGQLVKEATALFDRLRAAAAAAPAPSLGDSALSPNNSTSIAGSGWRVSAEVLAGRPGFRFNFWCPPSGAAMPVWGDEVYSSDSSVCTAAVHAGTLSFEVGGNAIIEMRPGQASYAASRRNGVTTLAHGPASASFVIVGRR